MANYDSTGDTTKHQKNIQDVILKVIIPELEKRAKEHDASKLQSPEKECYDKYVPELKTAKYGTGKYLEIRKKMEDEGLSHHYAVNRHHPEHWPNSDIACMDLIDLIEMFADHYASSLRSDADYASGEASNKKRYQYTDQLYRMMMNTYNNYFRESEQEWKKKQRW